MYTSMYKRRIAEYTHKFLFIRTDKVELRAMSVSFQSIVIGGMFLLECPVYRFSDYERIG